MEGFEILPDRGCSMECSVCNTNAVVYMRGDRDSCDYCGNEIRICKPCALTIMSSLALTIAALNADSAPSGDHQASQPENPT